MADAERFVEVGRWGSVVFRNTDGLWVSRGEQATELSPEQSRRMNTGSSVSNYDRPELSV